MMLGVYPCCNGVLCLVLPPETPKFQREECPHCGKIVWHKYSRIEPMTYMEADFLALYTIDEANKLISERKAT
jgi:hypothetical protein